jgi:cytochrome P450
MPSVVDADKLPYLDAVLKETLRLYPINAGSQPRVCPPGKPVDIYDLHIPPGTICEMQALSVNRDPEVFENPDVFEPDRWMLPRDSTKFKEMNRHLWSFSSGQRMCIGQQ